MFVHLPADTPHYAPGFHPLDFQPLCVERRAWEVCPAQHWKHPLQRYDRHGPFLASSRGSHSVLGAVGEVPLEPAAPIFTHHFQYREESVTRRRLAAFSSDPSTGESRGRHMDIPTRIEGMHMRLQVLDYVYARAWEHVPAESETNPLGFNPRPWHELVGEDDARVARWYGNEPADTV